MNPKCIIHPDGANLVKQSDSVINGTMNNAATCYYDVLETNFDN